MKYLKKFNESDSNLDLISLDELETYFLDLIDEDFEIEEIKLKETYLSLDSDEISTIPREGFDFYRRRIRFLKKLPKEFDDFKVFESYVDSLNVFKNCLIGFKSAEDIKVLHIDSKYFKDIYNKNMNIDIFFSFGERLIEGDVNRVEGIIGDFYEWIYNLIRMRVNRSSTTYSLDNIKIKVNKDSLEVDCSEITQYSARSLYNFIDDMKHHIKRSGNYHLREIRDGRVVGNEINSNKLKYYEFDSSIRNRIITFKNIKLIDLSEQIN